MGKALAVVLGEMLGFVLVKLLEVVLDQELEAAPSALTSISTSTSGYYAIEKCLRCLNLLHSQAHKYSKLQGHDLLWLENTLILQVSSSAAHVVRGTNLIVCFSGQTNKPVIESSLEMVFVLKVA